MILVTGVGKALVTSSTLGTAVVMSVVLLLVGRNLLVGVGSIDVWLDGRCGDGVARTGWWGCHGGGCCVGMLLRGVVGEIVVCGCGWEG